MKKKFLALGMVLVLSFTMLIGCGSNTDKKDYEKLVDLTADLAKYMDVEDYADIDLDEFTKLQEDIEELSETTEEDLEAFVDAAKKAGVDEDDLDDLDLGL